MLQKLRSAGLGFFLKDEEKIPKLGMYQKMEFSHNNRSVLGTDVESLNQLC